MHARVFRAPAVAATMLLALAGCSADTSLPVSYGGAPPHAYLGNSAMPAPQTTAPMPAAAAPATFPPEVPAGRTMGLGEN
jgi:hypothetical protein